MARDRGHAQWPVLVTVLAASREMPEQMLWSAVVLSLQTNGRMLAAILWLQPPQVIPFWLLRCSRRVGADADTPATVSVMLQW